jgi:hypothetical protein
MNDELKQLPSSQLQTGDDQQVTNGDPVQSLISLNTAVVLMDSILVFQCLLEIMVKTSLLPGMS